MLQTTFVDHKIPDTSISTILGNKIYYYSDDFIYSYDISSSTHSRLFKSQKPIFLFSISESKICSVCGNLLKINDFYNGNEEIKLQEIPSKVVKYKDNLTFIYENSIEILFINKVLKPNLICIPLLIKDICSNEEYSFILTNENEIVRIRNIYTTKAIVGYSKIHIYPQSSKIYSQIFLYEDNIFLTDKNTVEKYQIENKTLVLDFTLDVEGQYSIVDDFLLSDSFIQLSKAPFLILRDRIFSFNGKIAISSSRIYFLKEIPEESKNEISYDMKSHSITINPNTIKIPEIFKDQKQKDQFLQNEIKIKKYEILLERMKEIVKDINNKEREVLQIHDRLKEQISMLENRNVKIREKVSSLRKKAEKIKFHGSSDGFYAKIDILNKLLASLPDLSEIREFKNILRAQKVSLLNKVN